MNYFIPANDKNMHCIDNQIYENDIFSSLDIGLSLHRARVPARLLRTSQC